MEIKTNSDNTFIKEEISINIDQNVEEPNEEISKPVKIIKCKVCEEKFIPENPYYWWNNKRRCIKCNTSYCNLPKTERDLFEWQDSYFETGDSKFLGYMYEYFANYSQSIILKYYQSYIQKNYIPLEEAAHVASTDLIEDICGKRKKITTSFGTMLIFKIKACLFGNFYNPSLKNKEVSINVKDEDNKEFFELPSKYEEFKYFENQQSSFYLKKRLNSLIVEADSYCDSGQNIMRLLCLIKFFEKGEAVSDKLFNLYNRIGKVTFEQTLKMIKAEIRKNGA